MRRAIPLLPGLLAFLLNGCGADVLAPLSLLPAGVDVHELHSSTDPYPMTGQLVTVSYTATLTDGTVIDSTIERGADLSWRLGSGSVIPGLDAAVAAMRVGSHARITIPPDQAYGSAGSPPDIPPDATLIYDLWLSSAQ